MPMIKKMVTAKAPTIGTVQVDNETWVKVDKATMSATKIGDSINTDAKPVVEDKKPVPSTQVESIKTEKAFKRSLTPEAKTDWAAKDRSQLVGGRSHDAVELVGIALQSCTPLEEVIAKYKEALAAILKIAEEVK